jgi:hypothetical protein
MDRREFIKLSTAACGAFVVISNGPHIVPIKRAAAHPISEDPRTRKLPDYADKMVHSDMDGLGPDGKPTGQKATYTGASKANATAEKAMAHKMKL